MKQDKLVNESDDVGIHPDLTKEDLKKGTVIITDPERYTVGGETFDDRIYNIVGEQREEREDVGETMPGFRCSDEQRAMIGYVKSQFDPGIYDTRAAMVIHGHQWITGTYSEYMKAMAENAASMYDTPQTKRQTRSKKNRSFVWEHGHPDRKQTFRVGNRTWDMLYDSAEVLQANLSSYFRHCVAISSLSLDELDNVNKNYESWIENLDQYITVDLPKEKYNINPDEIEA